MDVRKTLNEIAWITPWRTALERGVSAEALALVRECGARPSPGPAPDLQDLIARSRAFPLPFPIQTVRCEELQSRRPVERLQSNIASTHAVMHERVVWLIADFLLYKRQYGSSIEKSMYKDMSIEQFVDRLLSRRAATFMKAQDQYKLVSGEAGKEGWEAVGTERERAPLMLVRCLSYDEMKLSALVSVSGHTECVNDGARHNAGVVCDHDVQQNAVIIGIIGPRFKRPNRMEYEDILVTPDQNVPENGYGSAAEGVDPARRAYRKLWEDFYQIPSVTFEELTKEQKLVGCTGRRVFSSRWCSVKGFGFNNVALQRRVLLAADVALLEADGRAAAAGTCAFLNVVGAGLGIWKFSAHQVDAYVLTYLARAAALLDAGRLRHLADINFAYIQPSKEVLKLFETNKSGDDDEDIPKLFLKNVAHPRGGISVQLQSRPPAARLRGSHARKLLVLTYAWDSNALPGNEFWIGKLSSSGDSAAACSTQVSELHNARVNRALGGARACVAAASLETLRDYCARRTRAASGGGMMRRPPDGEDTTGKGDLNFE